MSRARAASLERMIFRDFRPLGAKSSERMTTAPWSGGYFASANTFEFWEILMKKTILTFGIISGVVSAGLMSATVPFMHKISPARGLIYGYTCMVLSFLLVYFGIRSYRDNLGDGHITFGRGFLIGIAITLISCAFYVGTWEVIFFKFMPHFMDDYGAHIIAKMQASGASAAAVQAKTVELAKQAQDYNNPLINMAYTFIEPFPVGLLITLVSAAILRRKAEPQTQTTASVRATMA
jgi:hypothetical protein